MPGEAYDVRDDDGSSKKTGGATAAADSNDRRTRLNEHVQAAQVSYNPSINMNKSMSEEQLSRQHSSAAAARDRRKRQSAPVVGPAAPLAMQESLDAPVEVSDVSRKS